MRYISHADPNYERVYVVGVKLFPGSHLADAYTVVLYNEVAREDGNRPVTRGGRILFCRDEATALTLPAHGDMAFRKYMPLRGGAECIYDLPAVVELIIHGSRDEAGVLADFLGELFDWIAATALALPEQYKQALHALADRTTFDKDFSSLVARDEQRSELRDALWWCVGAILASSALEGPPESPPQWT